jgi:hypothetical protein
MVLHQPMVKISTLLFKELVTSEILGLKESRVFKESQDLKENKARLELVAY